MGGTEVPYWFWKGLGLMVLWFVGKFIERKYFSDQKWGGTERRQMVEVDSSLIERYVTAYEKHVDLVRDLAGNSRSSLDALNGFIEDFQRHHDLELKNHGIIKDIKAKLEAQ